MTDETSCIQVGIAVTGTRAVLMKRRGNVRKPPIPKTVSALLVRSPSASEIPDHARPKNAIMKMMSRIPPTPVSYSEAEGVREDEYDDRLDGHPERIGREPSEQYGGSTDLGHEHLLKEPGVQVLDDRGSGLERAAEGVLEKYPCGCELEVGDPLREESGDLGELGEELREEDEEDDRLEEREEDQYRVAGELLQGPHEQVLRVEEQRHAYRPLLPNILGGACFASSSVLILFPVCFRKTSSRLGLERLMETSLMLGLVECPHQLRDELSAVLCVYRQAVP